MQYCHRHIDIRQFCHHKHSECCFFLKDEHYSNFCILNCYRSPSDNIDLFLNCLDSILDHVYKPNINFFVCVRFNIATLTDNDGHQKLQIVYVVLSCECPTRVTNTSVTSIDSVFVNVAYSGIACVFDNTVSDHLTIFVELKIDSALSPVFL